MDILQARKRAQQRAAQTQAPASAPAGAASPAPTAPPAALPLAPTPATPTPAPALPPTTLPPTTLTPTTLTPTTLPPTTLPPTTLPPTTLPPTTLPPTTLPMSSEPVDPLHGFLAIDDLDAAEDEVPERRDEVADLGQRYLAFRIGVEEFAASIMDIKEILPIRGFTEVPRAPRDVLGVISRRGVVLPVVDLGATLGLRDAERSVQPLHRVLVAGDGDRACGLRVDAVSEVVRLPAAAIEPAPASLGQRNAGLLLGLGRIGGRLFIVLDVGAVLDALGAAVGLPPQARAERLL